MTFTVSPIPFNSVLEILYDALYNARKFAAASGNAGRIAMVEGIARKAGEYARIAMQLRTIDTSKYTARYVAAVIASHAADPLPYPITRINMENDRVFVAAPFIGALEGDPSRVDFERMFTIRPDGKFNGATSKQRNEFWADFEKRMAAGAKTEQLHQNVIEAFQNIADNISTKRPLEHANCKGSKIWTLNMSSTKTKARLVR